MNSLTFATILALGLATLVACDAPEKIKKIMEECMEQENVSKDELKNFFTGGMKASDVTDQIKCHIKCVMERQGHLKNGVFMVDEALKTLRTIPALQKNPNLEKSVNACKSLKGTSDCETAYKISMCLMDQQVAL